MFKSIEIPRTTDTWPEAVHAPGVDFGFVPEQPVQAEGILLLDTAVDVTGVDAIFVDGVAYYRFAMYQYLLDTPRPTGQLSLADIAADIDTATAVLRALPTGPRDPAAYLTYVRAADPFGRALAYATLAELTEHRDSVIDLLSRMPSAIRRGALVAGGREDRQKFFIDAMLAMKDRYAAPAAD